MNIFLDVVWSDIFYNILSILIGIVVMTFAVIKIIKEKRLLFPIVCIIHSLLFIGFGIAGFFFPEPYNVIPILAILAFTITLIVSFLTIGKKKEQ